MPIAILCALQPRNSNGFEITTILHADPKTSHIPVIAIGDRRQHSQLDALRSGYADFVDRRLGRRRSRPICFLFSPATGRVPADAMLRARRRPSTDGSPWWTFPA